jgi:hypothetical protein
MQKFTSLISFVVAGITYFSLSGAVHAQSICPQGQFINLCKLKLDNASTIVSSVATILLIIAILLSLFFLIWGAIRWITSGGDKGKLDGARTAITAAIVGLILAFLAFFILSVLTFLFTGKGLTSFTIPTIVPK